MFIGALNLKIYIASSQSLKDKRKVIKSILARLRNKFNVSAIELDGQDRWKVAGIGVVLVSNNLKILNRQLSKIINFIESHGDFEVINIERDVF